MSASAGPKAKSSWSRSSGRAHFIYRGARAERSAIESLMFTLKACFAFGEPRRRTRVHVLAELLEKTLAYNVCQLLRVRERQRQAAKAAPAAA